MACVRALQHGHAWIAPQSLVELAVADVDRGDAPRAALEEDVRKASCRRPDVETVASGRVDPECVEPVRELLAPAGDVRRRRLELELRVVVDLRPRLVVAP